MFSQCVSISRKVFFFLGFLAAFLAAFLAILFFLNVKKISIFFVAGILAAAFFVIFCFFWISFSRPLGKIAGEMKNLLRGKKYRRFHADGCDEIAIISHFFNKITRNIESLSKRFFEQKKLNSELSLAAQIQRDILPKSAPKMSGLDVVARTRSATHVGGDSFDFIPTKNGILMYIGDVAGHGVPAGLVMTMANTLIHIFSKMNLSAPEILAKTNQMLHHRISGERFMTMALLRWDEAEQKMFLTGAGHEHLLIYRAATRKVEILRTGGVALRLTPDILTFLEEKHLPLAENDVVVLYTDGILEARNFCGKMYGLKRFSASLRRHGHRENSKIIFEKMTADFSKFLGDAEQTDDITMIIFRRSNFQKSKSATFKIHISSEKNAVLSGKKWEW